MTEFQRLVHAVERGIIPAKGTGGDFTPALVLCDWLEERGDPRVPTIRYTLKYCEEHATFLKKALSELDAKVDDARFTTGGFFNEFFHAAVAEHRWLDSTNKRLMLLLANRAVPMCSQEFAKMKTLCWMDAVPPEE